MWWFYLISLCGGFDAANWDFLLVPLLSFISKRVILSLNVNRDVGHKSEMKDILNLYRKKYNPISELLSDKKVKFV